MKIQVGDKFSWKGKANKKAVYLVTEITLSKIKYEVSGLGYIVFGSMRHELFQLLCHKKLS